MLLFVGLGNPTPDSQNNRHNIGFKVIDAINQKFGLSKQKPKFKGLLTTGNIGDKKVYAIKPLTFMNNSGICIRELIEYFKMDAADVIVFHDDLDIDVGKIKAKFGGSSAGHNGIESIDKFIGKDYSRVRIGIGKPESKISISIESLEIENNKLPDRFQNDPNVETLFKNANDQISEFILLADNSLLAMKVEDEKKERNLSLQEASRDIEEILRKENTFIAAKSYFDQNLDLTNENFITQIFEMNSKEEILIEIKNKKVFRFNIDAQLTPEIMGRIFSLRKKEFLFFYDKSKLFLVFVENITPNDIGKELKRTLMSQREEFLKRSLRQNFINNYLNFIRQNTDINVNENLIESTLSNLRRTG